MNRRKTFTSGEPVRRRDTLLFQFVCIFLSLTLLLCGCAPYTTDSDTTPTSSTTETNADTTSQDPLFILKQWLETDFSFTLAYQYMNLANNGMSQEITQVFATDESWSFKDQFKIWSHARNYETEEIAEYYYRYEDSQYVCYSAVKGDEPQRIVITDTMRKEMDESRSHLTGAAGLLPDYLQDLSVSQTDGTAVFTYTLPVEKILSDETLLSNFLLNVFDLSNYKYHPEAALMIGCTFETDPKTFQPKSLSFDFSQLKPYVLSNGAQSGEFALGADFMTMVYTFDYNLPATVTVPENMIP